MRTIFFITMMLASVLTFSACGDDDNNPTTGNEEENQEENQEENPENPIKGKTLIVYYSYTNNVHRIITELSNQIEADVIRVEPAQEGLDYAANNYAIGSALISAIRNNPNDAASYPEIKATATDLSEYETIIVAAPLWWSNMAAPLQTFLFNYGEQMAGKNIGLIVSSASSGISGVEADAKRLIPGGNFFEPSLWIRSSQTSNSNTLISTWLTEIK